MLISVPALPATDLILMQGFQFGGELEQADSKGTLNLDDGRVSSLAVDWGGQDRRESVGFYLSQQNSSLANGDERLSVDIRYAHLTATERWPQSENWESFVTGSAGLSYFDASGTDNLSRFSLGIATGFHWFLTEQLALRFEGRGMATFVDPDSTVFCNEDGCVAKVKSSVMFQGNFSGGLLFTF